VLGEKARSRISRSFPGLPLSGKIQKRHSHFPQKLNDRRVQDEALSLLLYYCAVHLLPETVVDANWQLLVLLVLEDSFLWLVDAGGASLCLHHHNRHGQAAYTCRHSIITACPHPMLVSRSDCPSCVLSRVKLFSMCGSQIPITGRSLAGIWNQGRRLKVQMGVQGPSLWDRLSKSFGYLNKNGYCISGVVKGNHSSLCHVFPVIIGETGTAFRVPAPLHYTTAPIPARWKPPWASQTLIPRGLMTPPESS
jgi:hypothetical protein